MPHRNLAQWTKVAVLAFGLPGCVAETASPTAETAQHVASQRKMQNADHDSRVKELEMNEEAPRKLIVSLPDENDVPVRLGVVDFDERNHARLSTEGSSPEVDQLKQDWQEVASQSELLWKKSVPNEVDGEQEMSIVGETVRPGDDNYVYAVLNTLERSYGYRVDYGD